MQQNNISEILNLKGKTAIVTGGAVGIGFGISSRLAEAGANVVIADVNLENADIAVTQLKKNGWNAVSVQTDISNISDIEKMISFTEEKFEAINILVNNAGVYPNFPILEMNPEQMDKVLNINLKGTILCCQKIAQSMIAKNISGKIINIASVDALHPSMIGLAIYDASKHGLWGFTKNFALELASHNISVNSIAPGSIATPGTGLENMSPEIIEKIKPFLEKIPMRRLGNPDDIGKVALFLASDLSSYMTGSQIVVDGGMLLS